MFKPPNVRTQAVQWCLIPKNTSKIKNILRSYIAKYNLYNANIDDCFSYVLDYFYNPDKVYYQNYTQNDSEYSIEKYVMANLNNAFNIYKSQILKKDSYYFNTESENKVNQYGESYIISDTITDKSLDMFFNNIENRELIESKYIEILTILNKYLFKNNYNKKFINNSKKLIIYLFIKPFDYDISKNIKRISLEIGISQESISIFLDDIKSKYNNNNEEIVDLYGKIGELLKIT